jgi:hypothetical protein
MKDGKIRHFGPHEGLVNECVWSVLQDRNKTLWAGTWGGGLFRLTGDTFEPVANSPAVDRWFAVCLKIPAMAFGWDSCGTNPK